MSKTNPKRITVIILLTLAVCSVFMYGLLRPDKNLPDWKEARCIAAAIGGMLRKYAELKGRDGNYPPSWQEVLEACEMDYEVDELFEAHYFQKECYSWQATYDESLTPPVRFTITVTAPKGRQPKHIRKYKKITLNHEWVFEKYEQ